MLKQIPSRIALALLGIAFIALIAFQVRTGIAGAKFGAVSVSGHPGTYLFFVAMQAFLASIMLSAAAGISIKRGARWPLIALALLFVWTIVEVARDLLSLGPIYIGLGIVLIIVMITLGYQFIWLEIRDRFRDRS